MNSVLSTRFVCLFVCFLACFAHFLTARIKRLVLSLSVARIAQNGSRNNQHFVTKPFAHVQSQSVPFVLLLFKLLRFPCTIIALVRICGFCLCYGCSSCSNIVCKRLVDLANHVHCSICNKGMSKAKLALHSHCALCPTICPPDQLKKHCELFHRCGVLCLQRLLLLLFNVGQQFGGMRMWAIFRRGNDETSCPVRLRFVAAKVSVLFRRVSEKGLVRTSSLSCFFLLCPLLHLNAFLFTESLQRRNHQV